jgi:alanyl-tRNA synthetase
VAPDRLRFDFTQGEPLSREQIEAVEKQVQEWVDQDIPVVTTERNLDEARGMGAMALFGKKYGETVRVVEVGRAGQDEQRVSLELCGGTHVGSTGVIGPFHVTSETGIGAGLRRIEAVTGPGAVEFFRQRDSALQQSAELLRCAPEDVPSRVARLQQQFRDTEKQRDLLLTQGSQAAALDDRAVQVSDISVIVLRQDGLDADALGKVADQAATKAGNTVVVLAAVRDDRVQFVCKVSREVVKRGVHAGSLVKALATRTGGGGGGRPDFAKAGGRDIAQVDEALALAPDLVRQMLEQH